jgi:hypothetical protein
MSNHGSAFTLALDQDALIALIRMVVTEALAAFEAERETLPERIAFSEPEAAALLGLKPWNLRAERLAGRIAASKIIGRRIIERSTTVALTTHYLSRFSITQRQKMRALKHLEAAGVIKLERRDNRNPLVTLVHERETTNIDATTFSETTNQAGRSGTVSSSFFRNRRRTMSTSEMPPVAPDPFDPARYRLVPHLSAAAGVKRMQLTMASTSLLDHVATPPRPFHEWLFVPKTGNAT